VGVLILLATAAAGDLPGNPDKEFLDGYQENKILPATAPGMVA